jgi:hypothetical protein
MRRFEIVLLVFALAFSFSLISGCDDAGVVGVDKPNPNVKIFDSIWVQEEDGSGSMLSGLDLLTGTGVTTGSPYRDAGLAGGDDTTGLGLNFYLRSGAFEYLLGPGHESKWFRVGENFTAAEFDTMRAVYDNIGASLDPSDFTHQSTESWEYFNTPMNSNEPHSIFCFWLKGKTSQNGGKNIYGIIQPIAASDSRPGQEDGFSISFRVRINTNGENDFRKKIEE